MGLTRFLGVSCTAIGFAAVAVGAQSAPDATRRCLTEPPGERAVALCRESLRTTPNDPELRRSLAAALIVRGDTSGALAEYGEIVRVDPHSARAQLDVATTLDRMGRPDEALRAYRRYLDLDPGEPRAHELVAWLLLQKGKAVDALAEFRAAQ